MRAVILWPSSGDLGWAMISIGFQTYLPDSAGFSLSLIAYFETLQSGTSETYLAAGSSASGGVSLIRLAPYQTPVIERVDWLLLSGDPLPLASAAVVELAQGPSLFTAGSVNGATLRLDYRANLTSLSSEILQDVHSAPVFMSAITTLQVGGTQFVMAEIPQMGGLALHSVSAQGQVTLLDQVTDDRKSAARDLSDMMQMNVGGQDFVITASATDHGLSSYHVEANGDLSFVDAIQPNDGLWISHPEAMAQVEVAGQSFVLVASSGSSSLSSLRVNPMGVFFVEDIAHDTLSSRFGGARVVESFQHGDRGFAVTAGHDGGLSVFEVLPGGALFHHDSLAQDMNWNIGGVTALSAVPLGDEVQILISGTQQGGIAHLTLDLNDLGLSVQGTAADEFLYGAGLDDLIMGGGGDDQLFGQSGDDILVAGQGYDRLTGGAGADIFVFEADGIRDRIQDFEKGVDRIHLDDWGMVYDVSSLQFIEKSNGAEIRWRDERIQVQSADNTPILVSDWGQSDFIF